MMTIRRWWRWALAGLVVAAIVVWAVRPAPVPVDAAVVSAGPLTVTVNEEGTTRVHDRYVIAAPITGRLARVVRREGDSVSQGDLLATLAPPPLDPRTRREAEARLAAALDATRTARAAVASIRAALVQAEREAERLETLFRQQVISAEARERAELEAESRRHELEAAEFQARAAAHEVEQARATITAGSSAAVEIQAPVSGRVLRLLELSERVVAAGTPLVELGSLDHLEVVAPVLSTDAVKIAPGDTMLLSGWGGTDTLRAVVTRVEPSAFTRVSALGVEEQRVHVVGRLDGAPGRLGDRFRVDVGIVVWHADSVLRVPRSALFRDGGVWKTFVIDGGRARERGVTIGQQALDWTEVRDGLAAGERVVHRPDDRIRAGTRVAVRAAGAR